jgi:hypothetical protein
VGVPLVLKVIAATFFSQQTSVTWQFNDGKNGETSHGTDFFVWHLLQSH